MLRLPLINMCNRETKRLPIAQIKKNLGLEESSSIPIEVRQLLTKQQPSTSFFVYLTDEMENSMLGITGRTARGAFFLTEVKDGGEEKIIDSGTAGSMRTHMGDKNYSSVVVKGSIIGRFEFYLPLVPIK